jgi:predicted ATP-dependent serine protease
MLVKYLANFGKVVYDSLEEGFSKSMKDAFIAVGMEGVKNRVLLLDQEPIEHLVIRLNKRESPKIVVIDSWQFAGMNYQQYVKLINQFRNKLFIIISHAEGKNPEGRVAKRIRYDSFVKIRVEGYRAFAEGRYGGNRKPYTIWDKGAYDYWGDDNRED